MSSSAATLLADVEPQMRWLLPADLYAEVWLDPQPPQLMRAFQHLRTLHHVLHDYVPRQVSEAPPNPGEVSFSWQEGTLLFTDLAGFTPLLEANATHGRKGAIALLDVLNRYFSAMVEIISKSGGDLLEFTGDAMLVQFLANADGSDTAQAVRAGLRMQRAMAEFRNLETPQGQFSLGMRVGIHAGRFLAADLGTPMRMVHVLMGETVQRAKQAETVGVVGRVCLTQTACDRLQGKFQLDPLAIPQFPTPLTSQTEHYALVVDNLTQSQLGEYDLTLTRRRMATPVLLDRSTDGLLTEIRQSLKRVEPLASYLPAPVLTLLVENAARRQIAPDFPEPIVAFVNLGGLPEAVEKVSPDEVPPLVQTFSRLVAQIHAQARSRGGILQKVTYHSIGSDMLMYFGVMGSRRDDAMRAVETVQVIRELVKQMPPLTIAGHALPITCRIGLDKGAVFSAEIGEPRGRREFNILGDAVNTAARLMVYAKENQILLTETVYWAIAQQFACTSLGEVLLKGKTEAIELFELT
ncbi:MAG TPA: adenylate/guanylate cyclase domain-containing protein [Synechococcales cyanobacterium M55_K2018_004]|nr:adenylate/guanylate cyclase domain-containing protein [Synechococcales cyanobacterium M55_K2018_004]